MSVQKRLEKYWQHDNRVGREIFKDVRKQLGGIAGKAWDEIDAAICAHPKYGSMKRFHKKYRRLNLNHECRFLRRLAGIVALAVDKAAPPEAQP